MRYTFKLSILLLGIIFLNGKCNPEKENIFVKKMVEFDKAFVPVLYYVYEGDLPNAKKSVFYLEHKWQQFHQRYSEAKPKSPTWNDNFCLMNQWLRDVVIAIDKGHRLIAIIQLNNIRHEMMDMRREMEIDYALDYIWDFEETLDLTIQVVDNPMMIWSNYDEFESIIFKMNTRWDLLKDNSFPASQYDMDAKTQKELLLQMNNMEEALLEFNQVVKEKELLLIGFAANNLHRKYLNLLHCFGEFQESKTQYVLNK